MSDLSSKNIETSYVLIATGRDYHQLAKKLIKSLILINMKNTQVILFTDNPAFFLDQAPGIDIISIENLKWPEATYLRYEIIFKNFSEITGRVIVYLDVDSIINRNPKFDLEFLKSANLFFVRHPGYFKRDPIRWVIHRTLTSPWETGRKFTCYVPLWKRRVYVFGAIWGGRRNDVRDLCEKLMEMTNIDVSQRNFPRSYDESYLNYFVGHIKNHLILDPEYAFVPEFEWINRRYADPYIIFEAKKPEINASKKRLS
jgi:hypothetical protein